MPAARGSSHHCSLFPVHQATGVTSPSLPSSNLNGPARIRHQIKTDGDLVHVVAFPNKVPLNPIHLLVPSRQAAGCRRSEDSESRLELLPPLSPQTPGPHGGPGPTQGLMSMEALLSLLLQK